MAISEQHFTSIHGRRARDRYIEQAFLELRRGLRRSCPAHMLDDVLQHESVRLVSRFDSIVDRYPQPEVYARVRAAGRRALIDFMRKDDAQRGAGARNAREVGEFDADIDSPRAGVDPIGDFVEADTNARLLAQALVRVSPTDVAMLRRVKADGCSVTEVAVERGMARETASRKIASALQVARASVDF